MKHFEIVSLNISTAKGIKKTPVERMSVLVNHGIEGDAHAGDWHRQISLLAMEDIEEMQKHINTLQPGDFAENITTRSIALSHLPVGTRLALGPVVLEITQIGKECHNRCAIFHQTGDCIMPKRGVFAKVIRGGEITHESLGSYDF